MSLCFMQYQEILCWYMRSYIEFSNLEKFRDGEMKLPVVSLHRFLQ